jgi:hypothetical protein
MGLLGSEGGRGSLRSEEPLDHVKWIGHLGGIGNHGRERLAIGTGEVERGVADLVPPWLPLFGQPSHGTCAAATPVEFAEEWTIRNQKQLV